MEKLDVPQRSSPYWYLIISALIFRILGHQSRDARYPFRFCATLYGRKLGVYRLGQFVDIR